MHCKTTCMWSLHIGVCLECPCTWAVPVERLHHPFVVQGVTVLNSAADACTWAELIILCGTYEDGRTFLDAPGVSQLLKGKTVLHLSNGVPQEASVASRWARQHGAAYLDACLLVRSLSFAAVLGTQNATAKRIQHARCMYSRYVFCSSFIALKLVSHLLKPVHVLQSQASSGVFGSRGASLMVCGDKDAWARYKDVVHVAAPAAFYGGRAPERANAVNVAICAFMTSVYMVRIQSALKRNPS